MKLVQSLTLAILASSAAYASDVTLVGSVQQTVPVTQPSALQMEADDDASSAMLYKHISLMKLELTANARQALNARTRLISTHPDNFAAISNKQTSVQLGMNNVPVLDQGRHGTCVTFANTAAIDAILDKGDYISQLCQLQLGQYLENTAYGFSGWDGSFGPVVLNQISLFGIVSKQQEKAVGCGGVTDYPIEDVKPATDISVADFHQISEPLAFKKMAWSPLLDMYQAFLGETSTARTLDDVKKALNEGERVTFGVLLFDLRLGVAGAVGKYHAANDAWVLTQEIKDDIEAGSMDFGGHEMLITGYDDKAIAIDDKGRKHRGLLTLRNSWGSTVGDKGNFYMSYDYFKALVIEAQRIRQLPDEI